MSNYCKCCGVSIPEEQNLCSICYGDPNYGNDGYYLYLIEHEQDNKDLYFDLLDIDDEG